MNNSDNQKFIYMKQSLCKIFQFMDEETDKQSLINMMNQINKQIDYNKEVAQKCQSSMTSQHNKQCAVNADVDEINLLYKYSLEAEGTAWCISFMLQTGADFNDLQSYIGEYMHHYCEFALLRDSIVDKYIPKDILNEHSRFNTNYSIDFINYQVVYYYDD